MKTLKRTLALVLALVLSLSAFTVIAGAAHDAISSDVDNFKGYTDADKAKASDHAEAIDVLMGLGIIEGYSKTEIGSDGTLTRGQAAKILAYLILGEDGAEALPTSGTTFDDVLQSHWASGYVAYANTKEILSGYGNGKFGPDDQLTAYQFAKILLNALGGGWETKLEIQPDGSYIYKDINKYTGANWIVYVAEDAAKVELFDGIDNLKGDRAITRAEAMQMVFNALKYDDGYKLEYEIYAKNGDGDDFGRPSHKWQDVNDKYKDISAVYTDKPVKTYTATVKGGTIYTDLGKPAQADIGEVYTCEDGKWTNEVGKATIKSGNKDEYGGNGTVTEVYKDDDNNYTFVMINTYLGKITKYADAKKDADGDITEKEYVEITKVSELPGAFDGKFETEAFEKKDATDKTYVLFTVAYNYDENDAKYVVKSAKAAEKIEDLDVTATNAAKDFSVGDKKYEYSKNHDSISAVAYEANISILLDDYGYVIRAEEYTPAVKKYAAVIEKNDNGWTSNTKQQANLLFADGTTQIVDLDSKTTGITDNDIVSWTEKDSVYKLKKLNTAETTGTGKVEIKGDKSTITLGSKTLNVNADTIFLVQTGTTSATYKYKAFTGYKKAPTIKNAIDDQTHNEIPMTYSYALDDNGNVKVVYVKVGGAEMTDGTASKKVLIVAEGKEGIYHDAIYDGYYTVNAVINGEICEGVKLDADKFAGNMIYDSANKNNDGVITALNALATAKYTMVDGKTVKYEGNVIKVSGTTKGYGIADDAKAFAIDEDGKITSVDFADIEYNSAVDAFIVINDDGNISELYIFEDNASLTAN